jgi:hypothetical protein
VVAQEASGRQACVIIRLVHLIMPWQGIIQHQHSP